MHHKHGAFYFVDKNHKWHNLGPEYDKALEAYASFTTQTPSGSMVSLITTAMPVICRKLKPNTRTQYDAAAKKLKSIFAEFKPEDVKPKHVAQVKLALAKTPNMANRVLTVLRLIFAYAVEQQLVEWNPCIGIKRHEEAKRTRLLTYDEIDAIKAKSPPRLRCMIDLLYLTGQRVGDILKLPRSALTDTGIAFKQQKTDTRLVVEWTPELRGAVEAAKALHTNVKALTLFHTRTGGPPAYTTVRDQWRLACERAAVKDANLHDLRARSITDAQEQGLDPQALAGHSERKMTERYIRQRKIPLVKGPTKLSTKTGSST
jgi:integrase